MDDDELRGIDGRAGRRSSRHSRTRRLAIETAVAVVLGLLVGVGLDVVRSGGPEPWLSAHGLGPPYEAGGRIVDVAGAGLYLDCRGEGTTTVILENGLGSGASGWGFVLPRLAERTRVCAYDRAQVGRSEPIGRHTVGDAADRLAALLAAAGERPPWILVGHSLGGVYTRVFAARHRDDVAGVVLVDAYFPDATWTNGVAVDPALRAQWDADLVTTAGWIEAVEGLDWASSVDELAASSLVGLPVEALAVDQHRRYDDPRLTPDQQAAIVAAWERWILALGPGTTRITIADRSGHVIQLYRPDLVVGAVERILRLP